MSRDDRREEIVVDDMNRHDFIQMPAAACLKTGCHSVDGAA
jgi:hypothetical protein